jgi:drug/metabolite transporter (DMT)-like permease
MHFLLFSIFSSVSLGLAFKVFPRYGVHTFQAIVVNYAVCLLCAWVALGEFPLSGTTLRQEWFPLSVFLGLVFITGFNIGAVTYQQFGLTIGVVMQRMSVLFSAAWVLIFWGEQATFVKILGIALAAAAIWFMNRPDATTLENLRQKPRWLLLFPALTLLISAVVEIGIFHLQKMTGTVNLGVIATIFGMAGLLGLVFFLASALSGKIRPRPVNLLAGVVLGVPNFLSIYFLFRALESGWGGSVVFPVNNVGTIAVMAVAAWWFFSEKLSPRHLTGLVLAGLAILLIGLSG